MAAGNAGNKSNEASAATAATTAATTTFSKADLQRAVQALADSIGTTNHIDDFVALFDPLTSAAGSSNNSNKATKTTIKNGLSVKEQRKLLHAALQTTTTAKSSSSAVPILDGFFARLLTAVQTAIQQQDFIPESAFVEGEKDDDDDIRIGGDLDAPVNVTIDGHARDHLRLLQHAAFCVTARLAAATRTSSSRSSSSSSSSSFFGVDSSEWKLSVALHEALHDIDPGWGHEAASASAAIVTLCEAHWLSQRTGREQVILHALPSLVEGALQSKPELKRLYTVREALTVIDFDSDESKPFASLLLRLVSIPSCLKAVEGKKLLSYLLRIGLCRSLHRSIRAQIPGNKASILHDYGDIYYQAWKEAADDDEQRELIELEIYQDLVYALVHAAKPPLVLSLLSVLEPLHKHQNNADVEALLYRMYGPLLWRALSAANERVRANAVLVLGHVFPLRAPPAEAKKSGSGGSNPLERALTALESALQDEAPLVRSEASTATAMVLTNFWDVIPPRDIRKLLNLLVVKHASDATSVAVRAGAVNAIAHILETPSSHAILRELLPPLGNLIHDKAEKVRLAVVKLLQRIKKVPNIKYYKVVSVNHLMARLVAEPPKKKANNNNSVVAGLTGLMVNSFAPENADVEQLVGRTQKFLIDYPRAAPTFYANLKKLRSSSFICQLVVGLYHCLRFELRAHEKAVDKRRSKNGGKRSRTDDNRTDEVDKDVNLVHCGTLVNVILVLWTSIKADLDQSVEWSDFVASEIDGKSLIDMVACFDDMAVMALPNDEEEDDDGDEVNRKDICNHSSRLLLQCAALLPRVAADSLMKALPSMSGASKSPAYFALMSVWGFGVGDELAASIAAAFGDDPMILPAGDGLLSKKKRLRGKSKTPGLKMDPLRAVRIVSAILKADDPSSNTARDSLVHCDSLFDSLRKASEYALCVVSGNMVNITVSKGSVNEFLLESCETFGRFILHREGNRCIDDDNNDEETPSLSHDALHILEWTGNIVRAANEPKAQAKISLPFADPDLSAIRNEPSFSVSPQPSTITRASSIDGAEDGNSKAPKNHCELQVMAHTLVASSCILISEWLAVGGSGSDAFAEKANAWCSVLPVPGLLLPFCRLAIQLVRQGNDCSLLKSILGHYKEGIDEAAAEIIHNTFSIVLSFSAGKPDSVVVVVEHVLQAAVLADRTRVGPGTTFDWADSDLACSAESMLPLRDNSSSSSSTALKAAVGAILRSAKASHELVRQLAARLTNLQQERQEEKEEDNNHDKVLRLLVHCLGMLSRPGSKARDEAAAAISKLATTMSLLPNPAGEMLEEFWDQIKHHQTTKCGGIGTDA